MFKRKRMVLSIIFAFILLLLTPNTTSNAADDIDIWGTKQITDSNKVWTIEFSQPLKETTIKKTTVYVEDENYRSFFTDATLSSDKKSIIVTPKSAYQENKTYKLHISKDIMSDKGKKLEKEIILPFVLNKASQNEQPPTTEGAIKNVTLSAQNFATMVTVVSNDSVNRVTANSNEMHYEGNNTYTIGLTGLTPGDNVTIQAYELNGKRVYSKNFKVN